MTDRTDPGIRRPDVRALIRSFTIGGSVVVPVSTLYERYRAQMAEQGRDSVTQKAFGVALNHCGQRAVQRRVGDRNVRCRVVNERFMAPEEFDTEPARI